MVQNVFQFPIQSLLCVSVTLNNSQTLNSAFYKMHTLTNLNILLNICFEECCFKFVNCMKRMNTRWPLKRPQTEQRLCCFVSVSFFQKQCVEGWFSALWCFSQLNFSFLGFWCFSELIFPLPSFLLFFRTGIPIPSFLRFFGTENPIYLNIPFICEQNSSQFWAKNHQISHLSEIPFMCEHTVPACLPT